MKRYLPSYENCFVCGKKNPRGLKLALFLEESHVRSDFMPEPELCGFSGVLHGGILSCLIDEALWWSSFVASGRFVVTKDLRVNYVKPVTIRKSYRVEADPASPEGDHFVCKGRITDQVGNLYVEGEGTYCVLRSGKKRNPRELLVFVDEKGNPLPEEQIYPLRPGSE